MMPQDNQVLLVDDSNDLRELLTYALEDAGFVVTAATGTDHAESIVTGCSHGFLAVVTDYHMAPGASGAELIRRLCEKSVEIGMYVLTSSDPMFEDNSKDLLTQVGRTPLHFLHKPYPMSVLIRLLAEHQAATASAECLRQCS